MIISSPVSIAVYVPQGGNLHPITVCMRAHWYDGNLVVLPDLSLQRIDSLFILLLQPRVQPGL
jgi:hypothetical protein